MNINKYDNTIDNNMLLSKVDNIFIQILTGIMFDDLDRVKHKISDCLYDRYKNILIYNNQNNLRQMFDELNIKNSQISFINKKDDKLIVSVSLVARYMNYFVNKETGEYVSGNNQKRMEYPYIITLEKSLNAKTMGVSMHCPGCGNPMNVNAYGVCSYCGTKFNTEDFDYVVTNIESIKDVL